MPAPSNVHYGQGVSPGIAIGQAYVFDRGLARTVKYSLVDTQVPSEISRFDEAVARAKQQLKQVDERARNLSGAAQEEFYLLLQAHAQMLENSRLIRSVRAVIEHEKINAEAAVQAALDQIADDFKRIDDPYLAARLDDIREVGQRLIGNLAGHSTSRFGHLSDGAILIGHMVNPADVALMPDAKVGGFISALGGAEGHTAILARALGLPGVVRASNILDHIETGDEIVIDGRLGAIIVNPDDAQRESYAALHEAWQQETADLEALRDRPASTTDGQLIALAANIELPQEAPSVLANGASGIGLMRSEFLFMNREDVPSEEEQYQTYRALIEAMQGKTTTIRTLDVGADKLASALNSHFREAENPALGLRAIRLSLRDTDLLEAQLSALLRAAAYGPTRILLPMISTAEEVRQVRAVMLRMVRQIARRGQKVPDPLPPLGVMIEVPAAALSADAIARECDFFSIGTNDLTMYTLAIDRGNDQVSALYNPLHPAVLRLIQFTTAAADRANIPVNLCGEMAGDPRLTKLLLGLGLRDLSMSAPSLPRIKRQIMQLNLADCTHFAAQIMAETDARKIAQTIASDSDYDIH
ncbi:MAG: phosphoenolpyruvate--protein phosphotransferase [Pseudomonadota bacterium]